MNISNRKLMAFVAAGLAGSVASMAHGQGTVINISGATLLENMVKAPASTNDYLDVDGDGIAGIFSNGPDQLAPNDVQPPFPVSQRWVVQYRVVGSVAGFQELLDYGTSFVTNDGLTGDLTMLEASLAYNNGVLFVNAGVGTGQFNEGNPGGAPNRSDTTTLLATWAPRPTPATGGIRIDLSPLDVPTTWAITYPGGTPDYSRRPSQLGYGLNPEVSLDKTGNPAVNPSASDASQTGGLSSLLAQLPLGFGLAAAGASPTSSTTVFDTQLIYAPIGFSTSFGTGYQQMSATELRHLFITGRLPNGENLVAITRDVGSGTRNGAMNSIGLDPSQANGENVGGLSTLAVNNNLGPKFTPSNKGGSSPLDGTVNNHRLAVGYSGVERGVTGSSAYVTGNRAEFLAVQNDIIGGTQYSRPHITEIVHNDDDGYIIGGPAVLASIGDPRNQSEIGGATGNTNARLRNPEAAAYINNITRSIEAFVAVPGGSTTDFTPGELAATLYVLPNALDNLPALLDATILNPNPAFNSSLQSYLISNNALNNAALLTFNTSNSGRVPTRDNTVVYSDGLSNTYKTQGGVTTIAYGGTLTNRNRIAGDFDGNALRNINDTAEMLKAWRDRYAATPWAAPAGTGAIAGAPGTDAIIEVLGDFDGDGSFDAEDVRYFADGLAKNASTGLVSRKDGFTRVDAEFNTLAGDNNFFNTTLATGAAYIAGASRGDVAGPTQRWTPNFAPIGQDGVIDCYDIDYVYANFGDWSDLADAQGMDLSADMNGDLVVDQDDIVELVVSILGTTLGDVNLDGVCDAGDAAIITGNLGNPGGWCDGDLNGDGIVDGDDLLIANDCFCGLADYNNDTSVDVLDFLDFIDDFGTCENQPTPCTSTGNDADIYNPDGVIDILDFLGFFDIFGQCS